MLDALDEANVEEHLNFLLNLDFQLWPKVSSGLLDRFSCLLDIELVGD